MSSLRDPLFKCFTTKHTDICVEKMRSFFSAKKNKKMREVFAVQKLFTSSSTKNIGRYSTKKIERYREIGRYLNNQALGNCHALEFYFKKNSMLHRTNQVYDIKKSNSIYVKMIISGKCKLFTHYYYSLLILLYCTPRKCWLAAQFC